MTLKPRNIVVLNSFKRNSKKHYLQLVSLEWAEVFNCLVYRKPLPAKYKDHALTGNLHLYRDCHIKPDLVLLYRLPDDDTLELHYLDTHSEVFKNAQSK